VLHPETCDSFEKMPKHLQEVLEKHKALSQWQPPQDEEGRERSGPEKSAAESSKEAALIEEMVIQRDLLFRKNQISASAATQVKRECTQDLRRLINENAQLIAEMNTLRTEQKSWQRNSKELEAKLMSLNAANKSKEMTTGRKDQPSDMTRAASAPDLAAQGPPQPKRGPKGPGGAMGEAASTPYVRRKIIDQQETYRRQKTKQMNQLPPVTQPPAGQSAARIKPSVQEKRFEQSLESLQAGRRQMERQGFDMGNLTSAAQAVAGFSEPAAGAAET